MSDRQALEEVEAAAPTTLIPELRTMLGAFLFRGDDVFKPVSVLSGGERSRLALLLLLLRPANLLILDEPTNHLDLSSKDVLLAALSEFPGTILFVSHDRHFIEHLATRVLEVKAGAARSFPGDYEYYLRRTAQEQADGDGLAATVIPPPRAPSLPEETEQSVTQRARLEDKRLKSALRSLEREEEQLMARIEKLEEERRSIEQTMALPEAYSDGERMRQLDRDLKANAQEHQRLTARWEEVASEIAQRKETPGRSR
jgi:ATP-binding cassette subfamily F protein 3